MATTTSGNKSSGNQLGEGGEKTKTKKKQRTSKKKERVENVCLYPLECVQSLFPNSKTHFNKVNALSTGHLLQPDLLYLQYAGGQRDVRRRWGPLQPDVGAVDKAGRLLGPRQRAAAVNGTGTAGPAAVPLRPGAPRLQAAEQHEQTGQEAIPRCADAMFSLG